MNRDVIEQDFRQPKYRNAKVEDYEFRADGALVRKDRWETAIRSIASMLGVHKDFECSDVVDAIRRLVDNIPSLCGECGAELSDIELIESGLYCTSCGGEDKGE